MFYLQQLIVVYVAPTIRWTRHKTILYWSLCLPEIAELRHSIWLCNTQNVELRKSSLMSGTELCTWTVCTCSLATQKSEFCCCWRSVSCVCKTDSVCVNQSFTLDSNVWNSPYMSSNVILLDWIITEICTIKLGTKMVQILGKNANIDL